MGEDLSPIEVQIHLAEFESLRHEIEMRATLSSSLIALELSALGIGLVAAEKAIDLYTGLGFLSIVLWLFWLDHTEQIWKLASYISLRLRPALAGVSLDTLGWERFLRELDAHRTVRATNYAALYITLLFGSVPPLLAIVLSVRAAHDSTHLNVVMAARFVSALALLIAWGFAVEQFRKFAQSRDQMDDWISHPETF